MPNKWDIEHYDSTFGSSSQKIHELTRLKPYYEGMSDHLLQDIRKRLTQLEFLYSQVKIEEKNILIFGETWQSLGSNRNSDIGEITRFGDLLSDATNRSALMAECFYMIAFRIVDATRGVGKQLGYIRLVSEPKGIRDLRNHLIVHPETKDPVVNRAFVFVRDGRGIVMEARRASGKEIKMDLGFEHNAEEFRDYLHRWAEALKAKIPFPWN